MEFYDVINKRRSIRQFEDEKIPRETLERILDAGLKAVSYTHLDVYKRQGAVRGLGRIALLSFISLKGDVRF